MVACSRGQVGGLGVDEIVDRGGGARQVRHQTIPWRPVSHPGSRAATSSTQPAQRGNQQRSKKILNNDKVAYQQGTYGFPIVTRWQGRALRILIESFTATAESARWSSVWSRVNQSQEDFLGTLKSPTKRAALSLLMTLSMRPGCIVGRQVTTG